MPFGGGTEPVVGGATGASVVGAAGVGAADVGRGGFDVLDDGRVSLGVVAPGTATSDEGDAVSGTVAVVGPVGGGVAGGVADGAEGFEAADDTDDTDGLRVAADAPEPSCEQAPTTRAPSASHGPARRPRDRAGCCGVQLVGRMRAWYGAGTLRFRRGCGAHGHHGRPGRDPYDFPGSFTDARVRDLDELADLLFGATDLG